MPPNKKWHLLNRQASKFRQVSLDIAQRSAVEMAVQETCEIREWLLRALNVRTNHVHAVVSIGAAKPEIALNALKANATRMMREKNCWKESHSPWAAKGSRRCLWNERSIEMAIDYVINGQGGELPKFE